MFDFILKWLKEDPHEKDSSVFAQTSRPAKKEKQSYVFCGYRSAKLVQNGPGISFDLWKRFHEKKNHLKFKNQYEQNSRTINQCQTSSGMFKS